MTPSQQVNGPIDELIAATEHKRDLELKLAEVKKFIEDVEPLVREKFLQEGTQNVRKNDNTVYLRRMFKVKHKDGVSRPDVTEALKTLGFGDLVKEDYQYARLCSTVKEIIESGEEVPIELQEFIEWTEEIKVIVKK